MIEVNDVKTLVDTHISIPTLKKSINDAMVGKDDVFDVFTILREKVITSSRNDETGDEKVIALAALTGVSADKKNAKEDAVTGLKYINKYWREQ